VKKEGSPLTLTPEFRAIHPRRGGNPVPLLRLFRGVFFRVSREGRDFLLLKNLKGVYSMSKFGSLGYALLKALAVEHSIVVRNGKWETRIPSCFEQIWRTAKPLTEEEYNRIQTKKKQRYEQNKKNALRVYKKLKEKLERELKRKEKAVEKISEVVEEIDRKLKENPTNTELMKKLQYWIKLLTIRQRQGEYLKRELDKFEQFLKSFKALPASEFPLWEEVGKSKGRPPRKHAELEEYSDAEGFSIHYLGGEV